MKNARYLEVIWGGVNLTTRVLSNTQTCILNLGRCLGCDRVPYFERGVRALEGKVAPNL
jgi:hypothetical protein